MPPMPTLAPLMGTLPLATLAESFLHANTAGRWLVVLLMIGSIMAWSIMVTKLSEFRTALRESKRFLDAYRREPHPLSLAQQRLTFGLCPLHEMYRAVCRALAGLRAERQDLFADAPPTTLPKLGFADLKHLRNTLEQTMDDQIFMLEKNIVVLATAVTAAPFVGLLGTVWGVMDAFASLAHHQGSATLSAVAPGVSGSLIATLVGLIVALPSLIGYNFLASRIRVLSAMMEHYLETFMADIERCGQSAP